MNFKQALIAHLQGERVECLHGTWMQTDWTGLGEEFERVFIGHVNMANWDDHFKFRLAPRTIMCNGVEVPAPESVAPRYSVQYFIPDMLCDDLYDTMFWSSESQDGLRLERGLVYLNKDDAIARAKAMLIVQEVK